MTDETVHIQPAIPSRANPPPQAPAPIERHPNGARVYRDALGNVIVKKKRSAKKKAAALSPAEIRKINAKRKKNLKKPRRVSNTPKMMARRAAKHARLSSQKLRHEMDDRIRSGPKNSNRPLEMKNQLSAVLSMVGTLQKAELVFFSQAVPAMQALSRAGRRRVISALQQVYG